MSDEPQIPPGESLAGWAARITACRLQDAIDELSDDGAPSRARVELVAASLGLPSQMLAAELRRLASPQGSDDWLTAPPLAEAELEVASLTPPFLAESYLYRDLGILAGPGGSNKTTLALWEAIHIALGRPLYGLRTCASTTLYITGEDSRERLGARLHALMTALELSLGDRGIVRERVRILDAVGRPFRLCEADRAGNVRTSDDVSRLIDRFGAIEPGLAQFDPLASFGAPEESVNAAAQGAVNAARRIIRELGCGVRLIHHTGQQVFREGIRDQYAPRGGTALPDGARMVHVISRPGEEELVPFSVGIDDQVFILSRPKCSFCPPQPDIFVRRLGFWFEYDVEIRQTQQEKAASIQDQLLRFLAHELSNERKYTATALEQIQPSLKITQKQLRAALSELRLSKRVIDAVLPKNEQQGGKKTYLKPATPLDSVGSATGLPQTPSSTPLPSTTPLPYREKINDGVESLNFLFCSTTPLTESTGFNGVDGMAVDKDKSADGEALKNGDEATVREYLPTVESDPEVRAEVLAQCLSDPEYMAYWLARAEGRAP